MATAPYSKFRPPWDDTHPLWGDALQYVHVSHGTVGFSTAVQNYTVGGSGCVLQLAYPCKGLGEGGAREGELQLLEKSLLWTKCTLTT